MRGSDPGANAGLRPGRRFHLVERLGAGSFGEVYLAEQDSGAGFRRRVALKLLAAQVAHHGEAGRRMRDEARILGRLAHRNIVSVLDLVQLGATWAVVMDYVQGADLDRVLEALERSDAYMPPAAALEIAAAVADALDYAWRIDDAGRPLHVLHRDVKPGNVLLTRDGEVKVLDFGVARVNLETRESRTGVRVGTERYMSPQRLVGDDDGLAGDVYALAATLAELLLRYPIGKSPVASERHAEFVHTTRQSLADMLAYHELPAEVAAEVVALVSAGLLEDPAARPDVHVYAERFSALSRATPGEALIPFSRRFVPTVDGLLGRERELVDGVLSEGSTLPSPGSTGNVRSDEGATRPPDAFELDDPPVPPPTRPPMQPATSTSLGAPPTSPRWLAIAGGLAGVGLLAVGIAIGVSRGGAGPAPAVTTPPPPTPVMTGQLSVDPPMPAPTPAAVVETPAPTPTPAVIDTTPRPKRPDPVAVAATPAPIPADAPRVARALVVAKDASSVRAVCGDVTAEGSTSASVRKFPAGPCRVSVVWLGKTLDTELVIDRAREVNCAVEGEQLTCR